MRRGGDMYNEGLQKAVHTRIGSERVDQESRWGRINMVDEGNESRERIRDQVLVAEDEARNVRERAFDAGLIGRGKIVAPGVENMVLVDFVEPKTMRGGDADGNRWGIQVDLNVPLNMEDEGITLMMQQSSGMEERLQARESFGKVTALIGPKTRILFC